MTSASGIEAAAPRSRSGQQDQLKKPARRQLQTTRAVPKRLREARDSGATFARVISRDGAAAGAADTARKPGPAASQEGSGVNLATAQHAVPGNRATSDLVATGRRGPGGHREVIARAGGAARPKEAGAKAAVSRVVLAGAAQSRRRPRAVSAFGRSASLRRSCSVCRNRLAGVIAAGAVATVAALGSAQLIRTRDTDRWGARASRREGLVDSRTADRQTEFRGIRNAAGPPAAPAVHGPLVGAADAAGRATARGRVVPTKVDWLSKYRRAVPLVAGAKQPRVPAVHVATARTEMEAQVWRSLLDAEGIPCFIRCVGPGPANYSVAICPHELYVFASHAKETRRILGLD